MVGKEEEEEEEEVQEVQEEGVVEEGVLLYWWWRRAVRSKRNSRLRLGSATSARLCMMLCLEEVIQAAHNACEDDAWAAGNSCSTVVRWTFPNGGMNERVSE